MARKDEPIYVSKRKVLDSLAKKQSYRFRGLVETEVRNIEQRSVASSGLAAARYDELADLVAHEWDERRCLYRRLLLTRDRAVAAQMVAITTFVFVLGLEENNTKLSGATTSAATLAAVLFIVRDATRLRPRDIPEAGPFPQPTEPNSQG